MDIKEWFKGTLTWLGVPGWCVVALFAILGIADFIGNVQWLWHYFRKTIAILPAGLGSKMQGMPEWALILVGLAVGFGLIFCAAYQSAYTRQADGRRASVAGLPVLCGPESSGIEVLSGTATASILNGGFFGVKFVNIGTVTIRRVTAHLTMRRLDGSTIYFGPGATLYGNWWDFLHRKNAPNAELNFTQTVDLQTNCPMAVAVVRLEQPDGRMCAVTDRHTVPGPIYQLHDMVLDVEVVLAGENFKERSWRFRLAKEGRSVALSLSGE